jgi:hypothetical protein
MTVVPFRAFDAVPRNDEVPAKATFVVSASEVVVAKVAVLASVRFSEMTLLVVCVWAVVPLRARLPAMTLPTLVARVDDAGSEAAVLSIAWTLWLSAAVALRVDVVITTLDVVAEKEDDTGSEAVALSVAWTLWLKPVVLFRVALVTSTSDPEVVKLEEAGIVVDVPMTLLADVLNTPEEARSRLSEMTFETVLSRDVAPWRLTEVAEETSPVDEIPDVAAKVALESMVLPTLVDRADVPDSDT